MKSLLIALMLFSATPAIAAPIYLKCAVTQTDDVSPLDVAVDEAAGIATYTAVRTGYTRRRPAVFSPTMVTFTSLDGEDVYTINRIDLKFSQTLTPISRTFTGECVLQPAPTRAF